jgi:hypothetical protein
MSPVLQKREAVGVGGTPETLPYSLPEVADKTLSLVATEATNVGEYFDFTIPTLTRVPPQLKNAVFVTNTHCYPLKSDRPNHK